MVMIEGYRRQRNERHNELIWLAWHTAALSGMKKLPSLESLIQKADNKRPHKKQTDEEMIAMCRILNAAFGGKVVET